MPSGWLDDLDEVDWPESIKKLQQDWVGKSVGAEVDFKVDGYDENIRVFTTRPDTLFGATYMVLAPEHKLVDIITTPDRKKAVVRITVKQLPAKATSTEPIWQKKRRAFSPALMRSILSMTQRFPSG